MYSQNSGAIPVITDVKTLKNDIINIFFFTYKLCEQCILFRTLPVRGVGKVQETAKWAVTQQILYY